MGYGLFMPAKQLVSGALLVRGMRSIQAVTFPLPWRAGKIAAQQCLKQWRERDWYQFMSTQVRCPFEAWVMTDSGPELFTFDGMLTKTKEEAQYRGLYFAMDGDISGADRNRPLGF